jgi:hypothetical protein
VLSNNKNSSSCKKTTFICQLKKSEQITKSAKVSNTQIAIQESFSCIEIFLSFCAFESKLLDKKYKELCGLGD